MRTGQSSSTGILDESAIRLALSALDRYGEHNLSARAVLRSLFQDSDIGTQTRGQTERLVLGIARHLNTIDYLATRVLSYGSLKDLDSKVRQALRMSIYLSRWMDIPDSHSSGLLKEYLYRFRSGFRRISEIDLEQYVKRMSSDSSRLSVLHSHPTFLVETLVEHLGRDDAIELMRSNNRASETYIRVNTLQVELDDTLSELEKLNVCFEEDPEIQGVFRVLDGLGAVISSSLFREGHVLVQNRASIFTVQALELKSGDKVWDACAAPGMKTQLIWEGLERNGRVIASDYISRRILTAKNRAKKLGTEGVQWILADASMPVVNNVDKILIDAPCTSTGVLSSHPSYKWRLNKRFLSSITTIQNKILDGILSHYSDRLGTEIVYATCSVLPHEGESQIDSVLEKHDIELVRPIEYGSQGYSGFNCSEKVVRLFPHRHNADGFFIAKIRITS